MTDNQTVKERLLAFAKAKGLSARAFSLSCGLSENYVINIKKSIQPNALTQISCVYPDLNPGWLMTGEGDMLRSEQPRQGLADPDDMEALRRRIAELEETVERQNRVIDALTGAKGKEKDTCNIKRIG